LLQQSGSGPNAGALSNLGNLGLGIFVKLLHLLCKIVVSDIFNETQQNRPTLLTVCCHNDKACVKSNFFRHALYML